jgi:NAD(P) transhydrogenase subunit beta
MMPTITSLSFLITSVLFIVGIKLLASPKTARQGNLVAAAGMLIALFAILPLLHGPHGTSVSCSA